MSQGQRNDLRREVTPTYYTEPLRYEKMRDVCGECRKGEHRGGCCRCTICDSNEIREMLREMK